MVSAERILLTLWVGSLWAIGYIAAPTLFSMLVGDRQLAGEVAGHMFGITAYLGCACGALLLVARAGRGALRRWRSLVIALMLAATALGQFVISPRMAALKAGGLVEGSEQAARFAALHGISSTLFLIASLLGLLLVAAGVRGQAPGQRAWGAGGGSTQGRGP